MSYGKCGARKEDDAHELSHCPAYTVPRQTLIQSLHQILPDDLFRSQKHLEQILLYGSYVLNLSENLTIFKLIQECLLASGTFSSLYYFEILYANVCFSTVTPPSYV